ncbi:unknown [Prevotella sp. CAG:755]|nr:unknown [Prevotella sp. CAG:755]
MSLDHCFKLALHHLAAKGGDTVDEHVPVEVVELMLHDAGKKTVDPLIVRLELLVKIGDANALRAAHRLVNPRETEASLLYHLRLAAVGLHDLGVDIGPAEVLVLRFVVRNHIEVDDGKPDGQAHLRSGQSHAIGSRERFKHIGNQCGQLGIIGRNVLRLLAKDGLTVSVDRQYHNV